MAALKKRLADNADGDFFVDSTCIDCGACNWVAPRSFKGAAAHSFVYRQPATGDERRRAELALVACPVGAIGTVARHDLAEARAAFPDPIDGNVHHCGYHSVASYGAASYLIVRPEGNILIDSPRFAGALVRRIEALGGIATMFLTHRDDVADHRKFHDHFGCTRILHGRDGTRATADVEIKLEGDAEVHLDDETILIPTPGHTAGSTVLLYRERYLFSGDHLWWSPERAAIDAGREVCWHDWALQKRSVARLRDCHFEWLLPGHGEPCHFPAARMSAELQRTIARLR